MIPFAASGGDAGHEWLVVGFFGVAMVALAFLVVAPPILIPLGHRALRQGRFERAGDLATIAGVSSGLLFALTALFAPWLMHGHGDLRPAAAAIVLYPAALWILSRRLSKAVRAARGLDRT